LRTVFEHQVSLRWRDVDVLGHVNHAVFLTYLEEGRDAFYVQTLGRDPHYVVARVEIDLRAEVHYADRQLRVRIAVERVGTTSLTTRETILTQAGVIAAEARVVTVLWDASAGKPMAFAADDHARLAAHFPRPPADLECEALASSRIAAGSAAATGRGRSRALTRAGVLG